MARKKIITETQETSLQDLVVKYGEDNTRFNALKKTVEDEKSQLKTIMMQELEEDAEGKRISQSGGFQVTLAMQDRSTMNEDRLIQWLKDNKFNKGIVKKKEYVDTDALEKAIYNGDIPVDKVAEMDMCKDEKLVSVLTVKKVKEG